MVGKGKRPNLRVIQGGRGVDRGHKAKQKLKALENWEKLRRYWVRRCNGLVGELERVTRAINPDPVDVEDQINGALHRCFLMSRREGYHDAREWLVDEINVMRDALGEEPIVSLRDCRKETDLDEHKA